MSNLRVKILTRKIDLEVPSHVVDHALQSHIDQFSPQRSSTLFQKFMYFLIKTFPNFFQKIILNGKFAIFEYCTPITFALYLYRLSKQISKPSILFIQIREIIDPSLLKYQCLTCGRVVSARLPHLHKNKELGYCSNSNAMNYSNFSDGPLID